MTNNLFLYFIVFIGIFLSSIAGLYSISGLVIIFKGNIIATTLMAIALEISKVCISIYIHVFWKKANKLLLTYLTFALLVLMMITSAGVYSYLSKSYMTSTDTDVIYEKISLIESQIEIEKEKIKNKQEEIKSLRNYPVEKRDNGYYWKINGINAKITEYTTNIEKMTDSITPLRNKVLEINMEIGPLKYISLLLYQSEGKAAIDKSVQVFIGIVVIVFDPLAILLIFSGIHGLHKRRAELELIEREINEKREKEKERRLQLKLEREQYERENNIVKKSKKIKDEIIENKTEENTIDIEDSKIVDILKIEENIFSPINEKKIEAMPIIENKLIVENDNKKTLKIKKKRDKIEKPVIDEKKIIPPFIKNRPKKNKKKEIKQLKIDNEKKEEIVILKKDETINEEIKESDDMQSFKEEIKTEINNIIKTDNKVKKIDKPQIKIKKLKDIVVDDKNLLEEEIEKIREQMLDKEKAIDFLYNGERQEDYLIKRNKKKKNKI